METNAGNNTIVFNRSGNLHKDQVYYKFEGDFMKKYGWNKNVKVIDSNSYKGWEKESTIIIDGITGKILKT